jgi:3-oxoacyl-[acyl-carrier protein] reductase
MKINLDGKLALVCASTRGLGYACALGLYKSGCSVILTGRTDEGLLEAKSKLSVDVQAPVEGSRIYTMKVDLDNREDFNRFISNLAEFPTIDILVTNSGGPAPGTFESFANTSDFEEKCNQITFPAISLISHALNSMRKKNWGRIINISSIGLAKPITGLAVSNASRSYLAGLMTGIANENAQFGITLNTVMPGIIWTDRQKSLTEHDAEISGVSFEEMLDKKSSSIPAGVMGKPEDVGNLVTFLASDHAGYVNSQSIAVDGGFLGLQR